MDKTISCDPAVAGTPIEERPVWSQLIPTLAPDEVYVMVFRNGQACVDSWLDGTRTDLLRVFPLMLDALGLAEQPE